MICRYIFILKIIPRIKMVEQSNSIALESILRELDEIPVGRSVEVGARKLVGAQNVLKGGPEQQFFVYARQEGFVCERAVLVLGDKVDHTAEVLKNYAKDKGLNPVDGVYEHRQ
jgi:hypothetical protein